MQCRIPEYRNSQLTLRAKFEARARTHAHTHMAHARARAHTHARTHTHTQRILKQWDHTVSIKYAGTLTDLYQTADIMRPMTCTTNRQLSYSCLLQYFTEPCLRHAARSLRQDAKVGPLQIIPVELSLCTLLSECNSGLKLIKTCSNKTAGKVCLSKYMLCMF